MTGQVVGASPQRPAGPRPGARRSGKQTVELVAGVTSLDGDNIEYRALAAPAVLAAACYQRSTVP